MEEFDISKYTDKFIEDASDLLNDLEKNLLELENNIENKELTESVFRVMHTLKGTGSMYGFFKISEYTHVLESIFDSIRSDKIKLTGDIFDVTFRSIDHIRNLLNDKELENPENLINHQLLVGVVEQIIEKYDVELKKLQTPKEKKNASAEDTGTATWLILIHSDESFLFRGIKLLRLFDDLAKLGNIHFSKHEFSTVPETGEPGEFWEIILVSESSREQIEETLFLIADDCRINKLAKGNIFDQDYFHIEAERYKKSPTIVEYFEAVGRGEEIDLDANENESSKQEIASAPIKEIAGKESFAGQHISVGVEKLDQLMYLVSEMVILKSELQNAGEKQDMELILTKIDKVEKLTKQLRNVALSIRLVQLRELTVKFKRMIRDLSKQLDKKIELVTQGEDVELDKNMIDLLADPLMHLIRNCIDHGVESPEERLRKGKSETGVIKISAFQSGNFVFLQISDDGAGIDKDKIRQKAVELKFINSDSELHDKELYELIFKPGFSTAEHLTQVSGRGVGMDVVKRRITDLRGEIDIETEIDLGTSFTIKLQQTLTIIDSMLIRTGDSYFTIPLDEVEVCTQEYYNTLANLHNTQIQFNDDLIPFVHLRRVFKIKGENPEKEKIIIIRKQNHRFAVIADSIIGSYQAVLKPMGKVFDNKKFIAGASVMGDGNLAVMLDTANLLKKLI
jgi:two-component system chemotaxis sensor kinase CheA